MLVQLRLYDLTNGVAKSMSTLLLGKYLEGIWHSSIVVFGIEYFYGGGIIREVSDLFLSGVPTKVLDLGQTSKTQKEFEDFLESVTHNYTLEAYHLLYHNCNHFSNECSLFLLGTQIPEDVKDLPEEFMSTSFGQMILPLIEKFMHQKNENVRPVQTFDNYIGHDDVFPQFTKIRNEQELYEFTHGSGIIVFWDPRDDGFILNWIDKLNAADKKIACVDTLRFSDLSRGPVPCLQAYIQGELILTENDPEQITHIFSLLE